MVVTQGHLFGFVWSFFLNPRRCCISQVPELSLSTSFCLLLKRFRLTTCLSLSTGLPPDTFSSPQLPSLPELACLHLLEAASVTGFLLILTVCIPVKKGTACLTWSGGPEGPRTPRVCLLCLWIRCHLKI